jgi:hypothetical protein
MKRQVYQLLESLEAVQLDLGLYTTRVTAEDLRRAITEAEGVAPSLTEVEVALRDLVTQGSHRMGTGAVPLAHR